MQKWQKLSKKIAKMQKYRIFALEPRSRELFACQKPVFQKTGFSIGFFFKSGFFDRVFLKSGFFNRVFLKSGFFNRVFLENWEKIRKNKENTRKNKENRSKSY